MGQKYFLPALKACQLFKKISDESGDSLLACLEPSIRNHLKGEYLKRIGEPMVSTGVLLEGVIRLEKEDCWGNRSIIATISAGDLFGESFACAGDRPLPFNILAATDCQVMYLNTMRLLTTCGNACSFHNTLIRNLISILATKNTFLLTKISHVTQRKTRDKILDFLSDQSRLAGNSSFTIPFNRQEMADYLSVDRSALSSQLAELKNEGILRFTRNKFTLL